MELKFIGTGSAFSDETNNSAYLINNGNMLLIDCGENVFSALKKSNILNQIDNLYVFITHTHSDHIGSLSTLIHYMYHIKNKKVAILYNDNYKVKDDICTLLKINGNTKEQFVFENLENVGKLFSLNRINVCEVKHSPNLKSYAIRLEGKNKLGETESIVYTGDTCDELFLQKSLQDESLKKIYVDVSAFGGVHLKFDSVVEMLKPYKKKVVFMHIENGLMKNKIQNAGFVYAKKSMEIDNDKAY